MIFTVTFLSISLLPLKSEDIERIYNRILLHLGLSNLKSKLILKESKIYDRIVTYNGISIKILKGDHKFQYVDIVFTREGLDTYFQLTSHDVKYLLYFLYYKNSRFFNVKCKRIDILSDYLPKRISHLIKFTDDPSSNYIFGSRASDILLRSILNSDRQLYEYRFKNLFSSVVSDDYLIKDDGFSDSFKYVLDQWYPKTFYKISQEEKHNE